MQGQKLFNRRVFLQTGSALALMALLPACLQKPPLRLAGHKRLGFEIMFMAWDLGWFAQDGISFYETTHTHASIAALRNGDVQGAMLALDDALRLCREGLNLKIILLFDMSIGADAVLVRPELSTPDMLRGRTIGYQNSASGVLMLHEFLQHYGFKNSDFNLLGLSIDKHEMAWQRQQVDILITFEPVVTKLVRRGARVVFDSRQAPDLIYDVLVVTENAAVEYRSTLEQLLRTYFRALHHFRSNPMDASHRIAKRMEMKAEDVLQLYHGLLIPDALANYTCLSEQDACMETAINKLTHIMQDMDVIGGDCGIKASFTNEFIPKELL